MTNEQCQVHIKGMHCASCVGRLEKIIGKLNGVNSVAVNLALESMDISWQPKLIDLSKIAKKVAELGFELIMPVSREKIELEINGMNCASCSARIERVISGLEGIIECAVNLTTKQGTVVFDPLLISRRQIREKINDLGYSAEIINDSAEQSAIARQQDEISLELVLMKQRLVPALILSLLIMLISMGSMAGLPLPDWLSADKAPIVHVLMQFFLTLPVLWLGRNFYIIGFPSLLRGGPNMDSLIAVGTGAAFIYSCWNMIEIFAGIAVNHRIHDLYFESAAMLIALVSLGKYLEHKARARTSDAISQLLLLTPTKATVLENGQQVQIPTTEIMVGDIILVKPGERLPVDGKVVEGRSTVDESMISGESMPVSKTDGEPVISGTLNKNGILQIRAEKVGRDTALSRIVQMVQEAQGSKPPIARLVDRISLYFVPTVMIIACIAGLSWYLVGSAGFTFSLRIFIAVLVIACPCAMGLATPTSIMVGSGRGAQLGVLVKNGAALEQAEKINAVVFDKTGTLTYGKPALTDLLNLGNHNLSDDELLTIIAGVENASEHPLAGAIIQAASDKNLTLRTPDSFTAVPGKGLKAVISSYHDNKTNHLEIILGNQQIMSDEKIDITEINKQAELLSSQGKSVIFLAVNNKIAAVLAIADQIKKETADVVTRLEKKGIEVFMLTGDNEKTAMAIGQLAGISKIFSQVLPGDKAAKIIELQKKGKIVAMVGDGINDAPALARADLGMAMATGIDVAIESGDMVLMKGRLTAVLTALELSRATMNNIRQNLFWAFIYNIVGIPVAAGVLYIFGGPTLNPMIAGAAMAMSSVSVVSNSLRLRFFTP